MEQNYSIWHEKIEWNVRHVMVKMKKKVNLGVFGVDSQDLKGVHQSCLDPYDTYCITLGQECQRIAKNTQNHDSKKTPCVKTNGMHSIPITRSSQTITKVLGIILHFGSRILKRKKGSIYLINITKNIINWLNHFKVKIWWMFCYIPFTWMLKKIVHLHTTYAKVTKMKTCSHKIMWKNFKNVKKFKNTMQTFFFHECLHCMVNLFAKSEVNLFEDPRKPLPNNN